MLKKLFLTLCVMILYCFGVESLYTYPQNSDEALELYLEGAIDADTYDDIVKLLLNPVRPFDEGFDRLLILVPEGDFPSGQKLREYAISDSAIVDKLYADYPLLYTLRKYIHWDAYRSERFEGKVKSGIQVKREGSAGDLQTLFRFKRVDLFQQYRLRDSSILMQRRFLSLSGERFFLKLGNYESTFPSGNLTHFSSEEVTDDESLLYGNGRDLNGIYAEWLSRSERLYVTSLSYAPDNSVLTHLACVGNLSFGEVALGSFYFDGNGSSDNLVLGGSLALEMYPVKTSLLYSWLTEDIYFSLLSQKREKGRYNAFALKIFSGLSGFENVRLGLVVDKDHVSESGLSYKVDGSITKGRGNLWGMHRVSLLESYFELLAVGRFQYGKSWKYGVSSQYRFKKIKSSSEINENSLYKVSCRTPRLASGHVFALKMSTHLNGKKCEKISYTMLTEWQFKSLPTLLLSYKEYHYIEGSVSRYLVSSMKAGLRKQGYCGVSVTVNMGAPEKSTLYCFGTINL